MGNDNLLGGSCCNTPCDNSVNNNLNISSFWLIVIIVIFGGIPLYNDCFWNGYCNAFESSTFNYNSYFNNTGFNSTNTNSTINTNDDSSNLFGNN